MKIHHVSDSHGYFSWYNFDSPDVVVHSGDATNYWEAFRNELEFMQFLKEYAAVDCKYKIYVAGNHDSYLSSLSLKERFSLLAHYGIIYLENSGVVIDGVKFWGQPFSPTFNNWFFMRDRAKMYKLWEAVDEDVNVLVTHGPPKGILDLADNSRLEQCGDRSIWAYIPKWKQLKAILFGHIHNNHDCLNGGITLKRNGVLYSNAAGVKDGHFDEGIINNGNIINI